MTRRRAWKIGLLVLLVIEAGAIAWAYYPGGLVVAFPVRAGPAFDFYHRPDCRCVSRAQPESLRIFKNRNEAKATGARPCPFCKP